MCDIRSNSSNNSHSLLYVEEKENNAFLTFLYKNKFGGIFQKLAISKPVTDCLGKFYDSKLSKKLIPTFIQKNEINMEEYKGKEYASFNDFFTREKKNIEFSKRGKDFCAPCDGYLSAYKITPKKTFQVKGITYTLEGLLNNHALAKEYEEGLMFIFRLSPKNYHRYHYFDEGEFIFRKKINGVYHTVREVALKEKQVYIENQREYTVLKTKNFDQVLFMEVGALAVGKILNHEKKTFQRGEEKGMFLFGGSTIIVLFKKGILKEEEKLLKNSLDDYEAVVQCGCIVGERK